METINTKIVLTDGREICLELYPEIAPITVANFIKLVGDKFYNGLCFHRVIAGFMIQGGGFSFKDGLEPKIDKVTIKGEFASNGINNDLHHGKGVISMARTTEPDSASSQFFICVGDCSYLDGQYAAFGKVKDEASYAVVEEISKVHTGRWMMYDDVPTQPVVIKTIEMM